MASGLMRSKSTIKTRDLSTSLNKGMHMALAIKDTAKVAVSRNKEALAISARITAGNIINDRLVDIVGKNKQVPMMVKAAASTAAGKAVLANAFASAITHFMPNNEKANLASTAMVEAAMLEFVGSFNIEEMVNDLIDGVTIPNEVKTPSEED